MLFRVVVTLKIMQSCFVTYCLDLDLRLSFALALILKVLMHGWLPVHLVKVLEKYNSGKV